MNELNLNNKDLEQLIVEMEKENTKKVNNYKVRNRKTIYLKDETLELLNKFMEENNCNLSSIIQDCIESIILGEEDVKIEKREIVRNYNLKIESFMVDYDINSIIRDLRSNIDFTNKQILKSIRENKTEDLKSILERQNLILKQIELILEQQEELFERKKKTKKDLLKLLKEEIEKGNLKVNHKKR